uniref:Uncharacterized protein n=1 Tax=viral metagenome TaxID=1070528 RepID=A0A6C0AF88_9ZZZZ
MSLKLSYDDSNVKELIEYLKNILGENFDSFLKDSASYVFGNNQDKEIKIWVGSENSGKNLLLKLFLKRFLCFIKLYIRLSYKFSF